VLPDPPQQFVALRSQHCRLRDDFLACLVDRRRTPDMVRAFSAAESSSETAPTVAPPAAALWQHQCCH
jgi:hypothetical protein